MFPNDDDKLMAAAASSVATVRPSLTGEFPVTPADVDEFIRFAAAFRQRERACSG